MSAEPANARQTPVLLDRAALSEYLGISEATLDQWRADPAFPRPLARILRWRRADIDEWVASEPLSPSAFPAGREPVRHRRSKHDRPAAA